MQATFEPPQSDPTAQPTPQRQAGVAARLRAFLPAQQLRKPAVEYWHCGWAAPGGNINSRF